MDAGFSSQANIEWLKDHHYEYITVMRSAGVEYKPKSEVQETETDNRKQSIHLQLVEVAGLSDTVLLVNSDSKALKKKGMYSQVLRYEAGLKAIKKGIEGKGTKLRDKVNERPGTSES